MGVRKLDSTESVEALTYDRVWMDNLSIVQDEILNDAANPKYKVTVNYRMYAIAANGDYYFKNVPNTAVINDYFTFAMTAAGGGNMSFADGMAAIEVVVAGVIADQTGIATEVL